MGKQFSFRAMRMSTGMTQKQFGAKLGVDAQFISNLEREVAPIPPRYFKIISELCSVTVDELIDMQVDRYRKRLIRECRGK